jgi:hypothetical protein
LEAFRPVAAVTKLLRIQMVALTELDAARRLIGTLNYDALIVGANAIDSPALELLRLSKPPDMPAIGVTCVPHMREQLADAGANYVFLLPDQTEQLTDALRSLQKQSMH